MFIHNELNIPQKMVDKLRIDFLCLDINDVYKKRWLKSKILERLETINPGLKTEDIQKFIELMYKKEGEI